MKSFRPGCAGLASDPVEIPIRDLRGKILACPVNTHVGDACFYEHNLACPGRKLRIKTEMLPLFFTDAWKHRRAATGFLKRRSIQNILIGTFRQRRAPDANISQRLTEFRMVKE